MGQRPLKDLHLTIPKTVSRTHQNHLDGCTLFHVRTSTESEENSKRSKNLNSQVSYQQKMCMFYISNSTIFYNLKSKERVTD